MMQEADGNSKVEAALLRDVLSAFPPPRGAENSVETKAGDRSPDCNRRRRNPGRGVTRSETTEKTKSEGSVTRRREGPASLPV